MKRPNFFIIGAPKCGTTSLANWLSAHPRVYISPIKEPFFFNTDDAKRVSLSWKEYEALFEAATDEHLAVGEASTWYLSSQAAVDNIQKYSPEARFIVMIRNPLDMVVSLHQEELYSDQENEESFEAAWRLQGMRKKGYKIPGKCFEPKRLQYGEACKLGTQLSKLFRKVDDKKIHLIILDDMKKSPASEYRKVLRFLGVNDDHRSDFPVLNSFKTERSKILKRILRVASEMKKQLGVYRSFGIYKLNQRKLEKEPLREDLKRELIDYFDDEISLIEDITERDFSEWKR